MIEYFTALAISYVLHGVPVEARIWFETEAHCKKAMTRSDELYETIYLLYGNDIMMSCEVSDVVSKQALRPKLRPENFPKS